jgi:hypothetical protein
MNVTHGTTVHKSTISQRTTERRQRAGLGSEGLTDRRVDIPLAAALPDLGLADPIDLNATARVTTAVAIGGAVIAGLQNPVVATGDPRRQPLRFKRSEWPPIHF